MGRWFQINLARVCGLVSLALAVATAFSPPAARAGTIPGSERWATITHPGNAPHTPPPTANYPFPVGQVDYEYQISRTETTGGEWLEFVLAYAPYVAAADAGSSLFTSQWIDATQISPGVYRYDLPPDGVNRAVRVPWRYAARYVNWLHNGKSHEPLAFESGVYDTGTFGENPDGSITDQVARSPGATYFLPTMDEWIKAAYFDPNRHGAGQPGYWEYPISSDNQPVGGYPGFGETSAGFHWGSVQEPEVGSYVDSQSPWGLWDLSGGEEEFLETLAINTDIGNWGRYIKGTMAGGNSYYTVLDHIDASSGSRPYFAPFGFRIARLIPMPSGIAAAAVGCLFWLVSRKRS